MKPRVEQGPSTPSHPIDKRSGRSPKGHHHLGQGNRDFVPEVVSVPVSTLDVSIPYGSPRIEGNNISHTAKISKGHEGQKNRYITQKHEITKPLIPLFHYGHGKIGGGGTSKEATQRAKRKIRRFGPIKPAAPVKDDENRNRSRNFDW